MAANNIPTQLDRLIRPVREYLTNGPIDTVNLAHLDFVQAYYEYVGTYLNVHFMLEKVCTDGAPDWWNRSVAEFEGQFHEQYQSRIRNLDPNSEFVWTAAQDEVASQRLSPLPDDPTEEQIRSFLAHGRNRLEQTFAVELLLDMWVEAREG